MAMPIQRQGETYGVFDDGDLRFAREHTSRDLPEGLAHMLNRGPRISAGLNDPRRMQREADLGDAMGELGQIPGGVYDAGQIPMSPGQTTPSLSQMGDSLGDMGSAIGGGISDAWGALTGPSVTQGKAVPEPAPQTTNINASRRQAGDFDAQYDYSRPSVSDLYAHEPHHMHDDEFEREFPGGEPHHYTEDAFREQPQTPLQPLHDMLEHGRRPDPVAPPHDYLAQFRPHLASFTEARRHTAGGPTPEATTLDKAAAAVQPQVVPGWIGHGYAPGHRVGLPWREQVIPGTVTHLDGQTVGVRWDDGQHSTEEPSDLRPL